MYRNRNVSKSGTGLLKKLTERFDRTVYIGVAVFPTLTYPKSKILTNARKALDHASVFLNPEASLLSIPSGLNISGDKLYQEGKLKNAIEEFKAALALDSTNVNVRNSLGASFGGPGIVR